MHSLPPLPPLAHSHALRLHLQSPPREGLPLCVCVRVRATTSRAELLSRSVPSLPSSQMQQMELLVSNSSDVPVLVKAAQFIGPVSVEVITC